MAFALLTLVLLAGGVRADVQWDLETRILDAVQDIADIVLNQSHPLVDTYFGLTLAEVQIRLLLDSVQAQGAEKCPIGKLIAETEVKLRKALQPSEAKQETDDPLWFFINPELWQIPSQSKHFPLRNLKCDEPWCKSKEDEDILKLAMQGTPKEDQSDQCLIGLTHNCTVSQNCWQAQTLMEPPPHGYPLTHRLLFLQTARQLNCTSTPSFANISFGATIRNMCESILADRKTIESLDYPNVLQDLFTEQIVLCGIEGFQEFINLKWTEKILSWKLPSGCFPHAGRIPRSDIVSDGCSMHFTGLAAAALSIAARNMLEDVKFNDCTKF